jgi:EpsI family protein
MLLNRMTGVIGNRHEQVTYWIRIGDKLINGPPYMLNIARLSLGLRGYVADGLLFRVSEVTDDESSSNVLQDQFINNFLKALSPSEQVMLIGQTFSKK